MSTNDYHGLHSSFSSLLYTLRTRHLDQLHLVKVLTKLLDVLAPFKSSTLLAICRRVGSFHHPTLSNSGSCCPLHQEPGKSRTGLSLSNLLANYQSKRLCQAWILLAFPVASCPFTSSLTSTMLVTPSLISVPLLSPERLLPFRRSLCASCACLLLPVHGVVFLSPLLF